jgi:hypothetical protein
MDGDAADVALAGNTVAWLDAPFTGAHETPMTVMRARIDRASSPPDVAAFTWSPDGGTGNLLGDVHSGGSLIAFDTVDVCDADYGCPTGYHGYDVTEEHVLALGVGGSGTCASIPSGADPGDGDITFPVNPSVRCTDVLDTHGPDPIPVLALGGGRIALGNPDGSVGLISAQGTPNAKVSSSIGRPINAVTLDDANRLVLLESTTSGDPVLEVHDAATGALERSVPLALAAPYGGLGADPCEAEWYHCPSDTPTLRLESTGRGLVAYTLGRTLRLLRLADGRDVLVGTSLDASSLHAQLDQTGLFYAYDVADSRHPGRVVHLTWQALNQLFDRHG